MKIIEWTRGSMLAALLGLFALTSSALAETTFVAISSNSSVALPGQPVTFTVTEAFDGSSYNAGHNIYATVPTDTTVAQADVSGGTGACSSGKWPCLAGQQVVWSVQTSAQQTQSMQFTATVSSSSPPPAGALLTSTVTTNLSGSGSASTSVVAASKAGLEVGISAQSSVVAPGGPLVYSITYSNASAAAIAADLVVTLPTEVSFVSATNSGTHNATTGAVQWTLGTLAAGAAGQVTLTVKASNPVTGSPLINTFAELINPTSSVSLAQASNTAEALANPTQVSISSTASSILPGQPVIFTVTEAFVGSSYNAGHNIYATVPAYTTVAEADVSGGTGACSSGTWPCLAGQQVTWSVQTSAQQTQSMQFTATVSSSSPPPAGAVLSSVVTANLSGFGSASTNLVAAGKAGLELGISAQSSVVAPGGSLVYTLTYSNASAAAIAADLIVTLPSEVSFVSATNSGAHNTTTGVVQWTLGTLAAGASGQVALTVKVSNPLSGSPLINTAAELINATTSVGLAQASITTETLANPTPVSISAAGSPLLPGQPVIFTVTEAFIGSSYNAGHTIYATVPAYTTVASADSDGASCSSGTWPCLAGQQVSWSVQTSAQETQSRQFTATTSTSSPPPAGAVLSSTVTTNLSGSGSASTSVVAASEAGLELGFIAQSSVVAPGGSLVYNFTYSNASATAIAADLVVTLPAQVSFVSATNSGTHNTTTGVVQWTLGTLAAGASGQVALTVKVSNPLSGSPLINTVAELINPTTSVSLAQASNTAEALANPTQVSISSTGTSVLPGQSVTFMVTEAFVGNSYNAGHNISATVPAYTTVTQADTSGATCSSGTWPCLAGQQVSWSVQTSAQQTQSMQFSATVSSSSPPPAGTLLSSVVTTNLSGAGSASTSVVTASKAGLELGISAQSSVVAPGGSLVYTLTYSNASAAAIAADLVVTLPPQVSFVSATNSGSQNTATGVVQWTLGTLAAGASGQVTLTVKVSNPLSGSPLINTVAELINPTTSAALAQASNTAASSQDETQLGVSAAVAAGAIKYSVTEYYAATGGYNAGNTVSVTVPAYTQVAQASGTVTCTSGYCGSMTCSSGTWPCLAGQEVAWVLQTDAGKTQHVGFTATPSTTSPPPKGALVTSVVTASQSGVGSASVSVVAP